MCIRNNGRFANNANSFIFIFKERISDTKFLSDNRTKFYRYRSFLNLKFFSDFLSSETFTRTLLSLRHSINETVMIRRLNTIDFQSNVIVIVLFKLHGNSMGFTITRSLLSNSCNGIQNKIEVNNIT